MRMLGATVTRPRYDFSPWTQDEQVGVQCIAGVVTLKLEDGTMLEFEFDPLWNALEDEHKDAA